MQFSPNTYSKYQRGLTTHATGAGFNTQSPSKKGEHCGPTCVRPGAVLQDTSMYPAVINPALPYTSAL